MVTKIALAAVGPLTLAVLRFAFATALLLPWSLRRGGWGSVPARSLAALGLFGVTTFYSLQNLGLFYTSAASAGLIMGSIPVFTLVLSAILLGEAITLARGAGVALSVAGVSLIVLGGTATGGGPSPLLGNVLVLASAVSWAVYTVKSKALLERLPQHVVAAGSVSFGLVFLLPLALAEAGSRGLGTMGVSSWLAVGYLGLAASGVAFFLWNQGLKWLKAAEAGVFTNLSPVVAVVTAAVVLGETVSLIHLVGGAMTIGGVYLASLPSPLAHPHPGRRHDAG